ncbi:MAG: cupin [Alphaproteobacteria bacterium]|nr:cupin [Alphaproteobacteria bacterium]
MMTELTVFACGTGRAIEGPITAETAIRAALAPLGVRFERWPTRPLAEGASPEDVFVAYAAEIGRLKREGGYQSADVVRLTPQAPDLEALRAKFLDEHAHAEDEVRFFVEGSGAFYLRTEEKVFQLVCVAGDLISVPAGQRHWFDMGARPHFAAVRLFTNPDGWVARFTGDPIARRIPLYERAA